MNRVEGRNSGTDGCHQATACGYFGKVPTHGDFVSKRLDVSLTEPLDAWLHASIRASQRDLGRDWLEAFLVAPVWRLAMTAHLCGPRPVIGVMVPNVDRVGRYFPLVLATTFADALLSCEQMARQTAWFVRAEELALSTLQSGFDFAEFDNAAAALTVPELAAPPDQADAPEPGSFWWTPGTAQQEPVSANWPGLPSPERFGFLLNPATTALVEAAPVPGPARSPAKPRAGGYSMQGTQTRQNTDAWSTGTNSDLFAVIDGAADTPRTASAMQDVAKSLAAVDAPFSMNDLVAEAKGKLGTAHALLRNRSQAAGEPFAASVALLLLQARRYAVLWAGNARCHLWRDGRLADLTRDHVEQRAVPVTRRALGGDGQFMPDSAIGHIEPGDRFLLCTEGVSSALNRAEIGETLAGEEDPSQAAMAIVQDALIAGSAFDATAIVVYVEDTTSPKT